MEMPMTTRTLIGSLVAAAIASVALPAQAAVRTYVSPDGNDANTASSCSMAAPCRQFAAALSVTDVAGEILATGSGEYAHFTIDNKNVTITTAPGSYAAVSLAPAPVTGVLITNGAVVTLKGLTFKGLPHTYGVQMSGGSSANVVDCFFDNVGTAIWVQYAAHVSVVGTTIVNTQYGIEVSAGATVTVANTSMTEIGSRGIDISGGTSGTATVSVTDTQMSCQNNTGPWAVSNSPGTGMTGKMNLTRVTVSNCYVGIGNSPATAGVGQIVAVSDSMVTGNGFGLWNGAGTFLSAGNNHVATNGTDTGGIITTTGLLH
jgi:hypothetical protein